MDLTHLKSRNAELICIINAFNESFSQEVHSRRSYTMDEIIENHRFKIPYTLNENGETVFDLGKLSQIEPM